MSLMTRLLRVISISAFGVVSILSAWLLLQAFHECGHVLHGLVSGAEVQGVTLELFGYSYTSLKHNPHPAFVAWGGAIWGAMLPVGIWLVAAWARWRIRHLLQVLAGFCLVANGAYLAVGGPLRVGDADDLRRLGTPVVVLVVIGMAMLVAGFWMWHRSGRLSLPATKYQ